MGREVLLVHVDCSGMLSQQFSLVFERRFGPLKLDKCSFDLFFPDTNVVVP